MEEIKKRVDNMLVDRGLVKDYPDQTVRELLYHLFVAIDIYRYMTIAEKNKSGYWFRLFRGSYTLRNFLKERKRKRDKEKSPLHPSYKKESGVKEKAQNNKKTNKSRGLVDFDGRKDAFRQECLALRGQYDDEMLGEFYRHWSEKATDMDVMRFELETSWETENRVKEWSTSQITLEKRVAAIRLKRTRKKQQEDQSAAEKQQVQAAAREADNQRREQEMEESRKGKVSTEEYARQHPDSIVARLYREQQAKEAKTASRSPSGKTDKASGEVADKKGGAP